MEVNLNIGAQPGHIAAQPPASGPITGLAAWPSWKQSGQWLYLRARTLEAAISSRDSPEPPLKGERRCRNWDDSREGTDVHLEEPLL